jgi:hypothetical protein
MKKGFEVEVTGQYIARSGVMGKERILKDYKMKCVVPSTDAVLSVIKNKILGPKLKQQHEDYLMFRTYHILSITPLSKEDGFSADLNNIRYMSRPDLERLVKANALGVPTQLYPSLFKLRDAVLFASNDPKGYAKHLGIHREDLEMDKQVAEMNPELQEKDSEVYANTAGKKVGLKDMPQSSGRPSISNDQIEKQTEDRVAGLGADMKKDGEMGDMDEPAEPASVNDL